MIECRHRYGIQVFDIEDDNFTFDKERAKKLMSLIIQNFGADVPELTAMNGVSFASLDEELLGLMKRAGFNTINLSFVSTDLEIKEEMKRPGLAINFKEILSQAERVKLNVIAYAIFGMPGQTVREMVDTLVYLMGRRVLIGPSIYYPTPGTSLFESCREGGVLPPHLIQWRSSALPIETKEFNRLDLITLFRLARTVNFIKGRMDKAELSEGVTWKGLFRMMRKRANQNGSLSWMDHLTLLLEKRAFFGLRKYPGEEASLFKEETSQRVLDYFFEKAWDKAILRSAYH
jgi:hypothetical protein